jgi:hypothetical protein
MIVTVLGLKSPAQNGHDHRATVSGAALSRHPDGLNNG